MFTKFSDYLRKLRLKLYAGRVIIRRDFQDFLDPDIVFFVFTFDLTII